MKHQLDATLCRFYFCSHATCFGRKCPSSGVFKTSMADTGTCVIIAGKSSHLLIRAGTPALIRRCDDLPATITHVPVSAVLVLNTPDDGHMRPKHVEWLCRNKTCTVLHQVDVSFDFYYISRQAVSKINANRNSQLKSIRNRETNIILENLILFTKIKTTYVTKFLGIDSFMLMTYFSIQICDIIKGV